MREPNPEDAVEMAAFTSQTVGSSEAATFVAAVDGTIVSWSDAAAHLFGLPAWAAVGKPCHEIVSGLEPDGAEGCTADCPVRFQCRLGVEPPSRDLLIPPAPGGDPNRLVRLHHVTLNDPFGYVAGLLHVIEVAEHPHRTHRR